MARLLDEIAKKGKPPWFATPVWQDPAASVPGIYGRIMARVTRASDMASERVRRFGAGSSPSRLQRNAMHPDHRFCTVYR